MLYSILKIKESVVNEVFLTYVIFFDKAIEIGYEYLTLN